jgi:hypothetical protein
MTYFIKTTYKIFYVLKLKNEKKPERKMKECESSPCGETQFKVRESVEKNKKIKPKEVFGSNYQKKGNKK